MILKIPLCGPGISGRTDALNAAVLSTCAAHSLTKELPYLFISVAALGAFSRAVPTQAAWIGSGSGYDRCPPPRSPLMLTVCIIIYCYQGIWFDQ